MALNYTTYVAEMALLSQYNASDPNFLSNLPSCIDYATDRITRELDLLNTNTSTSTPVFTVGSRTVNLASLNPIFNVIRDLNVITPVGTTNPDLGQRTPLVISSRAFMNWTYGAATTVGIPQYWFPATDQLIIVGPYPDKAYNIEVIGTVRPTPISAGNPSNWISTYLPDLFLMASMIQMSAFKLNFGSMADDPKAAMSYEQQYVTLRDSAATEDAMRKYMATGWSSQIPNQFNPPRT